MPITTTGTRAVFTNDLGQPLIGGKVYTYAIETSTPKDTFKTALKTMPHTNPIILDDAGSVDFHFNGGYKIRVYDSNDVFIDEQDNVYQGLNGFTEMPEGYAYEYFNNELAKVLASNTALKQQLAVDINDIKTLALAGL